MKHLPVFFASVTLAACASDKPPDTSGLLGLTEQQATEALHARGLDNVSRVSPPPQAHRPSCLYAEHRDLVGWPCPPRPWIAVYFDREGGRATRVENGIAKDCAWP
jgi:hypothetical protein